MLRICFKDISILGYVSGGWNYTVGEHHIYGSSRIGVHQTNTIIRTRYASGEITITLEDVEYTSLYRGKRHYELSNHLGNVQVVVSDKRISVCDEYLAVERFEAEVLSAVDYYPFGAPLPDRQWYANSDSSAYSYGFNGMRMDNEISGVGNSLDFGARIYDSRLGRWLSRDPLESFFPSWSSYTGFLNNPIYIIDPSGKGGIASKVLDENGRTVAIKVAATIYIYSSVKDQTELHSVAEGIKANIENNWNSVSYIDPSTGEVMTTAPTTSAAGNTVPVIFEVTVIVKSREEVVDMVENNKLSHGENIIEIIDDETGMPSQVEGNSGVINLAQQRKNGTTAAHEWGHILEYINPNVTTDNVARYHADETHGPIIPMMSNDPTSAAERLVTQVDVNRLNSNKPIGKGLLGVRTAKDATVNVGIENTNEIYENGIPQE